MKGKMNGKEMSDPGSEMKYNVGEPVLGGGNSSIRNYPSDDEIDLVDILSVIFKRRWLIIWIVLASFVFSLLYVRFFTSTRYKTSIRIQFPQVYKIKDDYLLQPADYDNSEFVFNIKNYFNSMLNKQSEGEGEKVTGYTLNVKGSQISVEISNSEVNRIANIVGDIYRMYSDTLIEINNKNNHLYELSERSIRRALKQKESIMNQVNAALKKGSLKEYPPEFNTAMEIINTLSYQMINLEKVSNLNKVVELRKGVFEIIGKSIDGKENSMIINKASDLNNINSYIYSEKSRKRQYLPVIVAVFLGFFISIFMAFVVEFFSREDVRARLNSALKS